MLDDIRLDYEVILEICLRDELFFVFVDCIGKFCVVKKVCSKMYVEIGRFIFLFNVFFVF